MEPILQVISILKDKLNLDKIQTVLDLGCGSFYKKSLNRVKERDILSTVFNKKQITGIDIFEEDIKWRKLHGPNGNYICMNILDFEIKEHYDVIICHHVLEHLTQEEHDVLFNRIEKAECNYIILGGPVGYSDNSSFVELKGNMHEEHKIGLHPDFYLENGYNIFNHGTSFLAIKENK